MTLTIELPPELERRLAQEAGRRGQTKAVCARALLEERLAGPPARDEGTAEECRDAVADYANLPRRTPDDLVDLAQRQGASLAVDWSGLQPDFWPEDEDADEFLAALREWRRETTFPAGGAP
jgi:predicted transcriptional regulator